MELDQLDDEVTAQFGVHSTPSFHIQHRNLVPPAFDDKFATMTPPIQVLLSIKPKAVKIQQRKFGKP